jgi:hypothetical protein
LVSYEQVFSSPWAPTYEMVKLSWICHK